jgi:uncharacterized protein (DUF58 family)
VSAAPLSPAAADELARAERLLRLRSRREATGLFAGNYASAFRGGGLEFEESRPYQPGDDPASLDRNASARSGQLFVKRYRQERNRSLVFALDVSASMAFGTRGASKAATAAHAVALLVAAAARAGDRTGLVSFAEAELDTLPPGRGRRHALQLVGRAVRRAHTAAGRTRLEPALRAVARVAGRRAVLVLLSDFRDPELAPERLSALLAELARRHELIAAPLLDPAEQELPRVGALRVADPEAPGRVRLLHTGRARVRARYRAAALAWRADLERALRRGGAETLWLTAGRSPLPELGRFLRERAQRRLAP